METAGQTNHAGQDRESGDNDYNENDAMVTVLAEVAQTTEQDARRFLDDEFPTRATAEERRKVARVLRKFRLALMLMPISARRKYMTQIGASIRARIQKRAVYAQYPALRDSRMLRFASLFFSHRKVAQIFVPLVSDYRLLYREARAEGWLKAQVVRCEHWWGFVKACGLDRAWPIVERLLILLGLMR